MTRKAGKDYMGKKGFTLIEVITVAVIIAIAASIAAPNFANIIKRNQMRDIIQSAQWTEDATMALVGLQYARTATGNPLFVPVSGASDPFWIDESSEGYQYIYVINDRDYSAGGFTLFRVAPANIAAATDATRKSAGLTEFYKRTMNELPAQAWRGTGTFEDRTTCSVYFYLKDSNIQDLGASPAVATGKFVKYGFAYSEYFTEAGNRQFAIYHGARFHETDAESGVPMNTSPYLEATDPGWHIYENRDGTLVYYGSL